MFQGYLETFSFVSFWHNDALIELFFYIGIDVEVTTLEGIVRNTDIIVSSWLHLTASLQQACVFHVSLFYTIQRRKTVHTR